MKNILFIFHVSTFGGGSYCLLNIIKKLNKNKYNPVVLLKTSGPLSSELVKMKVDVHFESEINTIPYNQSIYKYSSIKQYVSVMISLRKISYWIKQTKADIVHINTMMMYPYAIPIKMNGGKVVIHVREHWPMNQHQIQFKLARKIINKYADKIIAINKSSSKILGLQKKTEIIYDWIDFNSRDNHIDFEKLFGPDYKTYKIYLFLGGIQKIKGALEVVQIFTSQIHDKNARLLFVGCKEKTFISEGFKGKIKKILRKLRLPVFSDKIRALSQRDERIVFIPATNQVKSLMEQSFCLLSYPTIPHAILPIAEAIYLGKPVISAETPEAKEYSNGGKSAILFEMNNKEEFKKAFLYSLTNAEKIKNMAMYGSKNIQSIFDPIKNSTLLCKIYDDL